MPDCNIEANDLVFVVADNIEQARPKLMQTWYGNKEGCHIDGYLELDYVDNYEVQISETKVESELQLYFFNIGFTFENQLIEQHEFFFIPAQNPEDAEAEAKKRVRLDTKKNFTHKDNLLAVDNCLEVNSLIPQYINLKKSVILSLTGDLQQPKLHSTYILL